MSNQNDLKGLGGWLILVGIGVVIGPLRLVYELGPMYFNLFSEGVFSIVFNSKLDVYNPVLGSFIIVEMILNILMTLVVFYLAYLFFTKHHTFPKWYIAISAISVFWILLDAWVGSLIIENEPLFNAESQKEFIRTLIAACIWIPYMLKSERVKVTFVENRLNEETSVTAEEEPTLSNEKD